MAIETVQAYQCRCGRCGKGFNTEGDDSPMVWINKDSLLMWLDEEEQEDNWHHINEDWYCNNCVIWDDNDERIVKPK